MSGLSLPVNRPTGRALLVASPASRAQSLEILGGLRFDVTEVDDPYAAMTELCRRPLVYRAVILSLASLYREELSIVATVKSRFPHVELWLAHTDGRQAALAEAMRLGADGLLADDGLHRVAGTAPAATVAAPAPTPAAEAPPVPDEPPAETTPAHEDAPILTPDELRALLHEQSAVPPDEH
jgi:hypothetical protein